MNNLGNINQIGGFLAMSSTMLQSRALNKALMSKKGFGSALKRRNSPIKLWIEIKVSLVLAQQLIN